MTALNRAFDFDACPEPASPTPARQGPIIDRYVSSMNRLIACALVGTLGVTAVGMSLTRIGVRLNPALFVHVGLVTLLFLGCRHYAIRGERRAFHLMLIASWIALTTNLHLLPMFLAGRLEAPLVDETLAGWDRALGIEAVDIVAWMRRHPAADHFFGLIYGSLLLLIVAGVIVVPLAGRIAAALENIVATFLSIFISFPIFAAFRARGPWSHYGYVPMIDQRGYEAQLAALQAPGWFLIDFRYKEGLICFPSYHTILAVLAAASLGRVPYLRPTAFVWAALIVASTLTTGSHYVVDVLAGLLVAAISMGAAGSISRRIMRRSEEAR